MVNLHKLLASQGLSISFSLRAEIQECCRVRHHCVPVQPVRAAGVGFTRGHPQGHGAVRHQVHIHVHGRRQRARHLARLPLPQGSAAVRGGHHVELPDEMWGAPSRTHARARASVLSCPAHFKSLSPLQLDKNVNPAGLSSDPHATRCSPLY